MSAGLDAVLAALDAASAPVRFFIRDDDAGWDDAGLFALLACTEAAGVPIDLAAIPAATGAPLARELCRRAGASGGLIGLHQHGQAHLDHELAGRKSEFGTDRAADAQRADLMGGRAWLHACFGDRLDAFFTPPWNRCSAATPGLLAALGYRGLSRDRSAPPQQALPELRVDVDWCREQRMAAQRGECGAEANGFALARHVRSGATVGLMLHHAQMGDIERDWLRTALRRWSGHPNARWLRMSELMPVAAFNSQEST